MKKKTTTHPFPSGNMFRRRLRSICCSTAIGIMTILGCGTASAQSPVLLVPGTQAEETSGPGTEAKQLKTIRIRAIVKDVEDEKILVESQSEETYCGEILLHTSLFDTRFVNGESGFRAELADIKAGDIIYADIRTTTAENMPPQTTAEIIICQTPVGDPVPDYVLTAAFEWQEDESWRLVSSSGDVYQIPKDCPVISYSMDELSSFRIISDSSKLLIWLDEANTVRRIVKLPARW